MLKQTRLLLAAVALCAGCGRENDVPEIEPPSGPIEPVAEASFGPADWPWWRGPSRNGIAPETTAPVTWSETENVVWKASIPGRGHSSPTVIGERIVLATADEAAGQQSVLCLDRSSGKQLWLTTLHTGGLPTSGMHPKQTHATCTVAADGERLFVAFLNSGRIHASALDMEGNTLWQTELGEFSPKFGYAPSPVIFREFVIFACDNGGGGFLASVHRKTGKLHWRKKRSNASTYSSPVIAEVAGKSQLLISGGDQVASYDPLTGEENWSCEGTTEATCGTMVWDGDLVFASGGYPGRETLAVKADGSGTVVWRNEVKCYEQSMLATGGYLYAVNDDGIAFCWEAATGRERWKKRLGGPVSASPVLAGGNIYLSNESGKTFVFEANPERFVSVATNQLGEEAFATPTIVGGRIYARVASFAGQDRRETLYCLGSASSDSVADRAN